MRNGHLKECFKIIQLASAMSLYSVKKCITQKAVTSGVKVILHVCHTGRSWWSSEPSWRPRQGSGTCDGCVATNQVLIGIK